MKRLGSCTGIVVAIAMLFSVHAAAAEDERACMADVRPLSLTKTRDLAFGRVTVSGSGGINIEPRSTARPVASGGVSSLFGQRASPARFLVEGGVRAPDGTEILITLPERFDIAFNGGRGAVNQLAAQLDDVGANWIDLGGGRYQCTLASGGRCAFLVGGMAILSSAHGAGDGDGAFRVSAEIVGGAFASAECERRR